MCKNLERRHFVPYIYQTFKFKGQTCLVNEYRGKISPHYYSNIYSKEHEIAWLSFLLWTRGGLHITVP